VKGLFVSIVLMSAGLFISTCGDDNETTNTDGDQGASTTPTEDAPTSESIEDLSECPGVAKDLTSFDDLVLLINQLRKPLSLPCFFSSLPRPLNIVATESRISAQPAISRSRPRIFIANDSLLLSVVPGEDILELGEIVDETRSIKGELVFPIEDEIAATMPYVNVGADLDQTKRCANFCHMDVIELDGVGGVTPYASQMIRPNPYTIVPFDELQDYAQSCADGEEGCLLLQSLFNQDAVNSYEFDSNLPFF
jgi:hypothetical protein